MPETGSFQCKVAYEIQTDDFKAVLWRDTPTGEREAFVFTRVVAEGGRVPLLNGDQPFTLRMEQVLRAIVDACAREGIIPGDMRGVIGAKDKHLEDMRAIAFGALKLDRGQG